MSTTVMDWLREDTAEQEHHHQESKPSIPAHDDIAKLAYDLWEQRQRNGLDGSAEADWFEAERQLHPGSRVLGE